MRELRESWRVCSAAGGWPFPGDWELPAVDAVCSAAVAGVDPVAALGRLGGQRADSGAGLAESLDDLAALYSALRPLRTPVLRVVDELAVDPDALVPPAHVRALALGWAEQTSALVASSRVVDALTGLATPGYLRTRLGEVYAAGAAGEHALLVVALDLSGVRGPSRLVPLLLAARVLRAEFDAGQTLARLGSSRAAVLVADAERGRLAAGALRTRLLVARCLAVDPSATAPVRVWAETLPATHRGACALVGRLGR